MKTSKNLSRIIAIMISFIMVVSSLNISAYADDELVTQGIHVAMYAIDAGGNEVTPSEDGTIDDDQKIQVGQAGVFRLEASIASTLQTTANVRIKLPGTLFSEENGERVSYMHDFEDSNVNSISDDGIQINLVKEGGEYFLTFDLETGSSLSHDFSVSMPNGITNTSKNNPIEAKITSDDIVITTTGASMEEKKTGGTLVFVGEFGWDNVEVSTAQKNVNAKSGKIQNDITYVISNASNNQETSGKVFTSKFTIDEKITLPQYVTFPDGEITVETGENGSVIKAGTQIIAEIDAEVSDVTVTDNNVLQFKISKSNETLEGKDEDKEEMDNPEYHVTLKNLQANVEGIRDYYKNNSDELVITNDTTFIAESLFGEEARSEASAKTSINDPQDSISVSKKSSSPANVAPGETIDYTLVVTNDSEYPVSKVFEFSDTLSGYLEYVSGSAKLKGYDASGNQIVTDVPDSAFVQNNAVWALQYTVPTTYLPKNKTLELTFTVKIKSTNEKGEKLKDETRIKNAATITADGKKYETNEVTDVYYAGDSVRQIAKSVYVVANKPVADGNSAVYSITLTNDSGIPLDFTAVDTLPKYIDVNSVSEATITYYTNENKVAKRQSITFKKQQDKNGNNVLVFAKQTLSKRTYHRAVIKYTAKFTGIKADGLKAGDTITNIVHIDEDKEKRSAATVQVKDRGIYLRLSKAVNGKEIAPVGDGVYSIPYTIDVSNIGDDYDFDLDGAQTITDIMSGGLRPEAEDNDSGKIEATYTTGDKSEKIWGDYTRSGNVYTIKWEISDLKYSTSSSLFQTGTISYKGYVSSMADFQNISNKAATDMEFTSTTVGMAPNPSLTKKIYSVNGQRTKGSAEEKCTVNSGDKVVYEIKIKNSGNLSVYKATLLDQLPLAGQIDGDTYYSLYDEENNPSGNVKILSAKFASGRAFSSKPDNFNPAENYFSWIDVEIAANDTLTIMVEVDYPSGAEFEKRFLLETHSDEEDNQNRVQLAYDNKVLTDSVSHDFEPTELTINKTVAPNKNLQAGDDAVFTLSDFGTSAMVSGYRLVDDLSGIYGLSELKSIQTGAYTGIEKYTLVLVYDKTDSKGNNLTKKFSYNNATAGSECNQSHTLSGSDLILSTNKSARPTAIRWEFEDGGDVASMEIKTNPKVTVTIPDQNRGGMGKNVATIYYDTDAKKAEAAIRTVGGQTLRKMATLDGKEVDNEKNPLSVGSEVKFRIEYKNTGSDPTQIGTDNPIADYMTTGGFQAGTYPISAVLLDASGNKAAVQGTLKADGEDAITISQADIDSDNAKQVNFTYLDADGNPFQIPANHTLRITYALLVSEKFVDSQKDKNTGVIDESNWNQKHNNSTIIHNEASYQVGEDEISSETGYYYQKGKNRLNMQKSVLGFGSVSPVFTQVTGDEFSSTTSRTYALPNEDMKSTDLNVWEQRAYKTWSDTKISKPDNSKVNFTYQQVDVVRYGVTVINDAGSNEDLVIKKIEDILPTYAYKWIDAGGVISSTSAGLKVGIFPAYLGYGDDGKYRGNDSEFFKYSEIVNNVTLSSEYLSAKYCVDTTQTKVTNWYQGNLKCDLQNGTGKPYFYRSNGNIVLKPGEGLTFSYAVPIDRSGSDPYVWTNTAVLNIAATKDKSNPFEINDDITIKSRPADKNKNAKRNEGECVKLSDTQFSSTVNIYPPESSLGITKTSSGIYQSEKYDGTFGEETKLSTINAIDTADAAKTDDNKVYASLSDGNKKVKFTDVVEWKIEVENGGIERSDVRITDELPDPYQVITEDGNYVMQRYNTETSAWENIAGTVETVTDAKKGRVQRIVAKNVTLDASTTTTFRVLARYDADAFYKSKNYINTAKLEIINASGNAGAINSVITGTPIRDSQKQTVGITSQDYVYPTLGIETDSLKGITNVTDETAWGNEELNYVKTASAGDPAVYTLKVTNSSTSTLTNFVLIDKLPQVGDTGTLETYAGRESEFSVNLADSPQVTVKKGDTDITSQVVISYKEAAADAAFTRSDWAGAGNDWTDEKQEGSNVIRINLSGVNVDRGETITVTFDAKVGADAAIGEIAWNSFGYAYQGTNTSQRLYAEPAKVGIKISGKEISLKKIWEDITGYTRPALEGGVKIHVIGKTADGQVGYDQVHGDIVWTESDDKTWTAKISGLPIRYEGETLIYTAEEVNSVTGYTIRLSDEGMDGDGNPLFTFINTQKKEISGLKTWNDGKATHAAPQLKLLKYSGGGWVEVTDKTPTWTDVAIPSGQESDGIKHIQKYVFDDLPAIDENGLPILYKVEEVSVGGYKCEEDADVIGNFINTLLTDVQVEKVWKDGDGTNRPTSININLLADGIVEQSAQLGAANDWKVSFSNLLAYNEDGSKVIYSIEESGNEKYTATTQVTETEGLVKLTVTNTLAASVNISGQKYWYDSNNQYGSRPESIVLKLLQNGTELRALTVKASENWRFEVTNLPRYDADGNEYTYTITEEKVTKYTEGKIERVSQTEDENGNQNLRFKISNTYNPPGSKEIELEFYKKLLNEKQDTVPFDAGDFEFDITYTNDEGAEITETVSNDADGKVSFKLDGITKEGTYTFTILERNPSSIFITRDAATITATVEVTCPDEELIVGDAVYYKNGVKLSDTEEPTFINVLKVPASVKVQPILQKVLIGGSISEGAFEFTIKNEAGTPQFEKTVTVGADGTIDFGEITFEEEGNYSYEIREAAGADGSIKYDETPIKLSVLVTAKAGTEPQLQADMQYARDGEILTEAQPTITNIQYAEVTAELSLYKKIKDGAKALKAEQFEFELYDEADLNTPIATAKNDANGKVTFAGIDALKYNYADADKTFTYIIKEKSGNLAGYGYSNEEITAKVTVTAGADNALHTTVIYEQNGAATNDPAITNTYTEPDSTTAQLSVNKSYFDITGGGSVPKAIAQDQFTFVLAAQDGAPMPAGTDAGNALQKTVKTPAAADGSTLVNFGDISYTAEGTYTYTITELAVDNPSIDCDTRPITATVKVELDEATNEYTPKITYTRESEPESQNVLTVRNTYETPEAAQAELAITKTLSGKVLTANMFSFVLKNTSAPEGVTLAADKTVENDADGKVNFGQIGYDKEGTYEYTITEVNDGKAGYTYSDKTVNVTVVVTKEANNELKATVTYKIDGTDTSNPTLENTYTKPEPTEAELGVHKEYVDITAGGQTPKAIGEGQFSFVLTAKNGAPMPEAAKGADTMTVKTSAAPDGSTDVLFGSISYTEAGTYTYTIAETAGTDPTISYDTTPITATVVIGLEETTNTYTKTITYSRDGEGAKADGLLTVTNKYTKPTPGAANIKANKTYTNAATKETVAIGSDQFHLTLTAVGDAPMPAGAANGKLTVAVPAGSGMQSVDFGSISYSEAGEYRYTITEEAVNDESVVIDSKTVNVTVNVKQNGTEMEATVSYDGEPTTVPTFANLYKQPVIKALEIFKKFTGEGAPTTFLAGQYVFSISGNNWIGTASNDATGKVTFNLPEFTEAGTYTYEIKEVGFKEGMEDPSITVNKDAAITATVTVTESADHVLSAEVTYKLDGEETSDPAITNTYTKPSPTAVVLEAEKSLRATSGSAPTLAAGAYSFEVKDADGKVVATAENAADGTITFPQITISDAGTYTYTISEVIPTNKETGIDYSKDTYKATVTAARKASENTLEIKSVVYEKVGGTTVDKPAFVNTYTPPTGTQTGVAITKTLSGKALSANQFRFVLKNTSAPEGVTLAADKTVENDADGKVNFGQIGYEKEGTYEYIITEENDGKAGYTYSDKTVNVTVVVTKETNNELKATVTYKIDGTDTSNPTLENTYTKPEPTEAELGVNKLYVNADGGAAMAIAKDQFSFVLTAKNGAPMPEAAKGADTMTVKTSAAPDGSTDVLFGSINYTELGTYTYTIAEEKGSNASISYDITPITATVVIGLDERTNTYTKTITYSRGSEKKDDGLLTVTNTYELPSAASLTPEVTKKFENADGSEKNFGNDVFTFNLYKSDANGTLEEGATPIETIRTTEKNASTQTIRFSTLSYTEDRELTEYYLIKEEAGTNPSITYDTEGILVKVEVKKVGNTLQATATYTKAGKTGDEAKVITNIYAKPSGISVTPQVTKELVNEDGTPRNFGNDKFTFGLYEAKDESGMLSEDAKPIETITTTTAAAAQELLKFTPISYTDDIEPGGQVTKYYVIKEAQGDNISINYDTTAIVYKVVYTKGADNKLNAAETYTIGGKQADDPTIKNTYKTPTPAETALTVEKYFYDKTAKADKKFDSEVFTFELFKAEDENGTLAEGATAIDTKQASGADLSRQTLTFLTLRHEQDMKPGDSVTEYYLIREKAPTNPSIKCENPEVIAKVVYSKANASGAYSDAANKIDVSVSYKMKGETAFAEGQKTVTNLYTEPEAVVPQAPIQVKKAFFDITGGEGAKTPKAIHEGEFSFTITPVDGAPMTGITQTVSTKDAASGTDTISFGNTTYTKEGVYRYLITENAGTNPSVAYDKHVIEVIVTVTKNAKNELEAKTEYRVKESAGAEEGTPTKDPGFENLYTEPTATNFVPEVSKHLVDVTDGTEADRAFGNDIFTFNLYKAKADGTIEGAVIDTVSTSAEDKAFAVKKLTFQAIELADDLAYGTEKTDFYYVIKEVKGDNPSITYDETAILVHAEVTKNADNKLEVKVTYSRGEKSSRDGLEVKNIYTKPQPAKYVIEFTKKYFDITSGTETAKNFGSEIFNFSLYESNENGEQLGEPIEEISTNGSTISSQDLAFTERVYDQDIEPGQTVTQYYLIKEKKGANYSIGYDTKGILVKVTLTKDKKDADHPNAKNEVIASVEYLKQTNDGFTGTWSGDKQVVRNTYTTPTPVVPESPIQVEKAFFDITGGNEAKTAKAIHAGEFSFTITPVDDAPMTGITPTVNTKDAASGIDTISFGSTTYTKEGVYRYLITETSGKNPSVTYDKRMIEVVVTVTKTSANKLATKTEYFVKENAEAAGTMTTNPTFENLYKAPTATNFVPEVIKHLVDVTSGAEIDRVFGKDSFTFKLYEADAAGTIKGEAIDTVSTGEEDKELALKKLAFKQIDISKDLEYGTDKTEYFYIIREEAEANPSIQDDVREILVKVTVTKTTDNKLAAKIEYIRGEEQKDTALTVTNRYTEPEPTSFTPEATKKLTGRVLKDGDFTFELLDAEGNVIDTAVNAEDGTIRFKELRFTEDADAKDYVYSVREVKGSMAGIIYDKSVFTMTVHVIKTAENKLTVESVTYLKDGAAADGIEFVNRRVSHSTDVSIEIKAEKRFEGGTLSGNDFSFKLEPMRGTNGTVRTASNRADGSISFGTFTYSDAGVYEYIISETAGNDETILYDTEQIKVTVTVTKELGRLVANVKYEKSGTETNQFINKLKEPDKATAQIRAKKVLKGRELNSGDFRFILTPLGGAPGEVQTVSNDADGNIFFNTIYFEKEGIYRYEITEMRSSSMKDILYDKEKITVSVTVSKDEDGNLTTKVSYSKGGKVDNRFINKTRESDGKPPQRDRDKDKDNSEIPKTGDGNTVWLWILLAGISGGTLAGIRIARRKEE